jgi:hypothetical protein
VSATVEEKNYFNSSNKKQDKQSVSIKLYNNEKLSHLFQNKSKYQGPVPRKSKLDISKLQV